MDKYEFNLKMEQMKKLIHEEDYGTALKIVESIDWNRVRNINLLTMAADVYEKNDRLEKTVDKIRRKYGHEIIQLATIKKDEKLSHLDIKGDHTIHPKSFFGN